VTVVRVVQAVIVLVRDKTPRITLC